MKLTGEQVKAAAMEAIDAFDEAAKSKDVSELTKQVLSLACACIKGTFLSKLAQLESEVDDGDVCGLCGEPGADKVAKWTGGGVYWPGEERPEGGYVHSECEQSECQRAHAQLTQAQRDEVLRGI